MSEGKIVSLDAVLRTPEQSTLLKIQNALTVMKERVKYYAEKLAAIGDENDALHTENENLRKENQDLKDRLEQINLNERDLSDRN